MVARIIFRSREILQDYEDGGMGMQVLVNLNFSDADSSEGNGHFLVQAIVTNKQDSTELEFELPPIHDLQSSYNCWQDNYYKLITQPKGFKKEPKNIPPSREECYKYVDILRNQLNQWLLPVKSELEKVEFIQPNSEIYFFINNQKITSEKITETLHKIPWREWDYFTDCDALEAVLYLHEAESNAPSVVESVANDDGIFRRVRITSIFGDVENIKEGVERDKEEIEKLEKRGAELIHLEQPQRQDLKKLWDETCDILFYSGHSNSEVNSTAGRFKINENDDLSLEEIRNTFREAIKKGLKIAIFNSCDGLGLACELAKLGLPYIIVWRESVPVEIAQKFIEYFLCSYSRGKSLFDSVRDARIKLKELTNQEESNKQIPGLNWLPIICVSTKDEPPLWEDLGGLTGKLPDSPYQGLSAFGEEDAEYFFGRDKFVGELLEAVNTKSLVPIIGASGSGKSSVVFAGLVPRLREIGMQIISFRPGSNPFDSLAVALKQQISPVRSHSLTREGLGRLEELELEVNLENDEQALCRFIENLKNLTPQPPSLQGNGENSKPLSSKERGLERGSPQRFILIIDQFEELYTLTLEAKQQPFLNTLLYAVKHAPNFCLIFTLRADFYGHAISHPTFSNNLDNNSHNYSPMSYEELRAVIEQPAAKLKVELEQGLAKKLIDDLGNQPGRLPLLEFTLSLLWEKHDKWYLTHKAYEEIGGLEKALAKYADGVLNPLSAVEKEKAERIFIQLISPGEGTEDTKRKATRGEVGEENWGLVEFLANQRLVVTGWDETSQQETVEIVHEALIREWGILREWIKSNRRFRIWQERIQFELVKWDKSRDEQYLLYYCNLGEAEGWYFDEKYRNYLSDVQGEFIRESLEKRDRKIKEEKRKQKILAGLSVVSLAFAGFASWNWIQSEIRGTSSKINIFIEKSKSSFDGDFHHDAIMEAMKASQLLSDTWWKESIPNDIQQKVKAVLLNVINNSIFVKKTLKVNLMVFSPDGKTIASASDDKMVKIWDTSTGKIIHTLKGHQDLVDLMVFSSDGKTIASVSHTVKIWDISTGKEIQTLEVHKGWGTSLDLSPDGKTIASAASGEKIMKIWDVKTGKTTQTFKGHQDIVNSVKFSPDGKTIASASNDKTVKIWDVKTAKTTQTIKGNQHEVLSVDFSSDGKTIASALMYGRIKIWDVKTGKTIQTIKGHEDTINSVEFSSTGKFIASASDDKTVKIWDVKTGNKIQTLKGHQSGVHSVEFSPDGKTIASGSGDDIVKIWDLDTGNIIQAPKGYQSGVYSVEFSPDSKTIASASDDGTVKIWDFAIGKTIQILKHKNSVASMEFSPDGKNIASVLGDDDRVKIWDVATGKQIQTTGEEIQTLKGNLNWFATVKFSPNGKLIASVSKDKVIKIWDAKTGKAIQTLKGHLKSINKVEFSPDGKTIASVSWDKTFKIWDAKTGKITQTFRGHKDIVRSVEFSPDSKTIASASDDKTVKIWDTSTGKIVHTLKGHQDIVSSVEFSPDAKTIVSVSGDYIVKIWDAKTGEAIYTFEGYSIFSPDGKIIASISDKKLKLWNWDLENLVKEGCNRFREYLADNPEKLEELKICQNPEILAKAASSLVKQGEELAKNGNSQGAVEKFRKAKKWNPKLDINPEEKAKRKN